jgi:hypothetical protein
VTLNRYFKRELAAGGAMLKQLTASKYFQALKAGESWAIRMAMRNRFNWVTEGSQLLPAEAIGNGSEEGLALQINFVTPSKKPEPIDVTPQPEPGYNRPALEPPRERRETRYGTYEYPRAEQPPSIFDRGDKNGWMK